MAQVKRKKSNLRHIADWQAADTIIRRLGDLQISITAARETAKDDIHEIKGELAEKVKPLQQEIKLLTSSLELFAGSHTDDFGKARSRKLNFGSIGWRKSTVISISKKTLELIKEIFSKAKAAACIRVTEGVDKEALAKFTDEELTDVKARRRRKDVFFVEPNSLKAVDYYE